MAYKKKGQLTGVGEFAKHLRKIGKRLFWKAERLAEKRAIAKDLEEKKTSSEDRKKSPD